MITDLFTQSENKSVDVQLAYSEHWVATLTPSFQWNIEAAFLKFSKITKKATSPLEIIILWLHVNVGWVLNQLSPSVSPDSSVSSFSMFSSFHYLIVRLQRSCSAFLPWWVFCRAALCRRLLTSSRNFLFPLTHPHSRIHTHWSAHTHNTKLLQLLLPLLQLWVVQVDKSRVWSLCETVCIICAQEITLNKS